MLGEREIRVKRFDPLGELTDRARPGFEGCRFGAPRGPPGRGLAISRALCDRLSISDDAGKATRKLVPPWSWAFPSGTLARQAHSLLTVVTLSLLENLDFFEPARARTRNL